MNGGKNTFILICFNLFFDYVIESFEKRIRPSLSLLPPDAGGHGGYFSVFGAAGGGVGGDEQRRRGVAPRHLRHRDPAGDVGFQSAHYLWPQYS